jgi:hypothetical protein
MTPGALLATLIVLALVGAALIGVLTLNDAHRGAQPAPPEAVLFDGMTADAPPLVAHALGLQGRPSLIARRPDDSIVVAIVRAGTAPATIAPPDAILLAAEMLAAAEALGVTPAVGELRFQDRALPLPNTPALRALALRRLGELQASVPAGPHLTRQDPATCRACAFRAMCPIGRANAPLPHSSVG